MLNKLAAMVKSYRMVQPGDRVICAVSGGADSVALLFAMYLLREKLKISLEAAHYNHHLRGEESDRDETFVKALCHRYDIPLHLGGGEVKPGKKGLEAAAREARYRFLRSLPGIVATAHTADDNAETVLMHLVRGTGLKGLGGIRPVSDSVIRPMLQITRQEVLAFLEEYHLSFVEDSSNSTDQFLRNRLRHQVMPLLRQENPNLGQSLSAMALRLREDEAELEAMTPEGPDVATLRQLPAALRSRALSRFLNECDIPEPEAAHIALAEKLVFSPNPSASAHMPGGITVCRNYGKLEKLETQPATQPVTLACPGSLELPGLRITCAPAEALRCEKDRFTVSVAGALLVRTRQTGDTIHLPGGSKSLKKLFIDKKIPAPQRAQIPVLADAQGIVAVYGIGPDRERLAKSLPAVEIRFEAIENKESEADL